MSEINEKLPLASEVLRACCDGDVAVMTAPATGAREPESTTRPRNDPVVDACAVGAPRQPNAASRTTASVLLSKISTSCSDVANVVFSLAPQSKQFHVRFHQNRADFMLRGHNYHSRPAMSNSRVASCSQKRTSTSSRLTAIAAAARSSRYRSVF